MPENRKPGLFLIIVITALMIKLSLFAFAAVHAPEGKMTPDSYGYLKLSNMLVSKGFFANQDGTDYEVFRTPGYPLFLAVFHGFLKIPLDGIVLIHIAMSVLAAFVVYRTALLIAPGIAFLSAVIILFDPPITIYSMTILSDSLFLLLISLFMFFFVSYLKGKKAAHLILSAFILAAAAYVRPVAYYLGFLLPLVVLYAGGRGNFRKSLKHAVIFIAVVCFTVGLWHVRNYVKCNDLVFCSSDKHNLTEFGLLKSYGRNTDPHTQGMAPLPYYINVTSRCLMSLMTRPGNFKYFHYTPLTIAGNVIGYPWMVFWLSGFILGALKCGRNIYIQFMLFVTLYFIAGSVIGQMWFVDPRLRMAMMPFIAIVSAYGWVNLYKSITAAKVSG